MKQSEKLLIFEKVYDSKKSIKDNLSALKKKGVDISVSTFNRYRRWIVGTKSDSAKKKEDLILTLFNPNLTYQENIEIFKRKGIKVSSTTLCCIINQYNINLYKKKYNLADKTFRAHVLNKDDLKSSSSRILISDVSKEIGVSEEYVLEFLLGFKNTLKEANRLGIDLNDIIIVSKTNVEKDLISKKLEDKLRILKNKVI